MCCTNGHPSWYPAWHPVAGGRNSPSHRRPAVTIYDGWRRPLQQQQPACLPAPPSVEGTLPSRALATAGRCPPGPALQRALQHGPEPQGRTRRCTQASHGAAAGGGGSQRSLMEGGGVEVAGGSGGDALLGRFPRRCGVTFSPRSRVASLARRSLLRGAPACKGTRAEWHVRCSAVASATRCLASPAPRMRLTPRRRRANCAYALSRGMGRHLGPVVPAHAKAGTCASHLGTHVTGLRASAVTRTRVDTRVYS